MRFNSLAFRLVALSALWSLLVLPLAGYLLQSNYRQDVERVFDLRLDTAWWALVNLSVSPGGTDPVEPTASAFGDPSYNVPNSGWYWQIKPEGQMPGGKVLISASLQGENLAFPKSGFSEPSGSSYAIADVEGLQGEEVRMFSKVITFGEGENAKKYRYIVTGNLSEADVTLRRFRSTLTLALSLLGVGLVVATLFQVRFGLRPLRAIERGLNDIRAGKATRLEGDLPDEIIPLQRELNELITANHEVIERARTHVGNLAHALKTPLSVLTNEASADKTPLGRKVSEQTRIMRDQVQHHLDRARMVARTNTLGSVTDVKSVIDPMVRVLERINKDKGIKVTVDCWVDDKPGKILFQGEEQDLQEMLGNLLDNAFKWAKERIALRVTPATAAAKRGEARWIVIDVEDDGPGLTEPERVKAKQRGQRLDETKPGSGLGLSIVSELAGLYKGEFELGRSAMGGLKASLRLPAA